MGSYSAAKEPNWSLVSPCTRTNLNSLPKYSGNYNLSTDF